MRSSFLLFTLSENILRGQFIILLTRAAIGPARHKTYVHISVEYCWIGLLAVLLVVWCGVVWCGVTTGTFLTNDLTLLCDSRRVVCGEHLYPISPVLSSSNI